MAANFSGVNNCLLGAKVPSPEKPGETKKTPVAYKFAKKRGGE